MRHYDSSVAPWTASDIDRWFNGEILRWAGYTSRGRHDSMRLHGERLGAFILGPRSTNEAERTVGFCTVRGVLACGGRRQSQDEGRSATGIVLGNNVAAVRFHDSFANTEAQAV